MRSSMGRAVAKQSLQSSSTWRKRAASNNGCDLSAAEQFAQRLADVLRHGARWRGFWSGRARGLRSCRMAGGNVANVFVRGRALDERGANHTEAARADRRADLGDGCGGS